MKKLLSVAVIVALAFAVGSFVIGHPSADALAADDITITETMMATEESTEAKTASAATRARNPKVIVALYDDAADYVAPSTVEESEEDLTTTASTSTGSTWTAPTQYAPQREDTGKVAAEVQQNAETKVEVQVSGNTEEQIAAPTEPPTPAQQEEDKTEAPKEDNTVAETPAVNNEQKENDTTDLLTQGTEASEEESSAAEEPKEEVKEEAKEESKEETVEVTVPADPEPAAPKTHVHKEYVEDCYLYVFDEDITEVSFKLFDAMTEITTEYGTYTVMGIMYYPAEYLN